MTTLSASRLYQIWLGGLITEDEAVTILGLGPTGDVTARRRLVHPDAENFEPILYWSMPDRTYNLDNEVLRAPIAAVLRMLEGSVVTRFEQVDADVVITELWNGSEAEFSMPGFQFRQLYEYLVNPPAFDPAAPVYIQYSPQDKNAKTYNVELYRLAVGSGSDPTQMYDLTEFFPPGQGAGQAQVGPLASLDEAFANEGSGLLDRPVIFQMKIVNEV